MVVTLLAWMCIEGNCFPTLFIILFPQRKNWTDCNHRQSTRHNHQVVRHGLRLVYVQRDWCILSHFSHCLSAILRLFYVAVLCRSWRGSHHYHHSLQLWERVLHGREMSVKISLSGVLRWAKISLTHFFGSTLFYLVSPLLIWFGTWYVSIFTCAWSWSYTWVGSDQQIQHKSGFLFYPG